MVVTQIEGVIKATLTSHYTVLTNDQTNIQGEAERSSPLIIFANFFENGVKF